MKHWTLLKSSLNLIPKERINTYSDTFLKTVVKFSFYFLCLFSFFFSIWRSRNWWSRGSISYFFSDNSLSYHVQVWLCFDKHPFSSTFFLPVKLSFFTQRARVILSPFFWTHGYYILSRTSSLDNRVIESQKILHF